MRYKSKKDLAIRKETYGIFLSEVLSMDWELFYIQSLFVMLISAENLAKTYSCS